MAVTYVDAGVVEYPSGGTSTTFTLSLSPAGFQVGDTIVFLVASASGAATSVTAPSGAVPVFTPATGPEGINGGVYLYTIPGPTKPGTAAFTWPTAQRGTLAWVQVRGAHATDPLDAAGVGAWSATYATSYTAPGFSTTTPGAFLVGGLLAGGGSFTPTLPAGWTRRTDAAQREGTLMTKGIVATPAAQAGITMGVSTEVYGRAWQLSLRDAAAPSSKVTATLTSEPYPGFTGDIADGAAIVHDQASPASSVVITTNKDTGGGLYVLGLDGQILSSRLDGAANSVDWRDLTGVTGWDDRILVMTTDREDDLLRYYWMNRTTKALTAAGSTSLAWEPYGTCLYVHSDGTVYAFVTQRGPDDESPRNMYQYPLTRVGETVSAGSVARTIALDSVVEGLAADDVTGYLFASEEDVGLYRYSAAPSGGSSRTTVDTVGGGNLVADVEDVAIARTAAGAWLLVSSQGDSSYHVYDLETLAHVQRFTIMRPGGSDQVTSTDGLDVLLADFGGDFPNGLIVVHDGDQTPVSDFAFVDAALVFGDLPDVRFGSSVAGAVASTVGAGHRLASGASTVAAVVNVLGSGLKRGAGSSDPGAEVSVTGSGASVRAGSSIVRAQASATGTGSTLRRGSSIATAQVAAVGSGAPAQSGSGSSVATATVTSVGVGSKRATGASTAGSVADATGAGSTVRRGSSTDAASVIAQGSGRHVESGRGHSTATALAATTGAGIKIAAGSSVAHATVTTAGSGHKVEPGRGSSVATAHAATVGVGYARRTGSSITTVTVTGAGTGHNPAGPDDVELVVVRGPYGTTFTVGSPYGTTLTITGPRR